MGIKIEGCLCLLMISLDMHINFPLNDIFHQKRKLRIFISNTFNPAKPDAEDGEGTVASWELRVEGRLLEDVSFKIEIVQLSRLTVTYTHHSNTNNYFILFADGCVQV